MTEPAPLPAAIESELTRLLDGPDAEFAAGVARLCRQHPERAAQIEATAKRARALLRGEGTAADRGGETVTHAADLRPGDRVGPFVILDAIGHGGMGSVFLAEQKEPVRRRVALKVIKLGMDTKAVLARFEAERQALALMDHTSIAKVYEAGATPSGRPYFAMEYVKGIPITRYCDDNKLSLDDRLALFKQVCSGVQHAHTKGVIHRDLTPNNVLVTLQDGKPTPKIIDFGLARATGHKLTEKTLFTEQGVILGTPEYMSPEQAGLNALDVDMRSDVYTLGVLLYELLTGKLPFEPKELRAAGYDAMCKTIREQDPPRPSTRVTAIRGGTDAAAKLRRTDAGVLLRRLRGDLDWIVMKCLEKDRTRRYETVSALADDVQRHFDSEPVLARAPSLGYRLAKFARRYRGQLVSAAAVFAALVTGLGVAVSSWRETAVQAAEATRQKGIAQEQARAAETARAAAADNAATAQRSAEEATRNATEALARKREFDQLASVVHLERALAAEKTLYPPWPDKVAAMKDWLEQDAGRLLLMQPGIEATLRALHERALERTPEEVDGDRAGHPRLAEWQKMSAKLASLLRAHEVRSGKELSLPLPTAEEQAMTPSQLHDLVWPRVTPNESERVFGEEARALMRARLAWDKASDLDAKQRAPFGTALAWAWFANGKDTEALAQIQAALGTVGDDGKGTYAWHLMSLLQEVHAAYGEAGAKALAALRAEVAQLTAALDTRRTYRFTDESQRFLHEALSDVRDTLMKFEANERHSVVDRLIWAERIESLTLGHPKARATWQQAREAIAKADGVVASALYRDSPIDLRPQMGLVPIGMNPQTKLWEFYELRSAWHGVSDPGSIEIPQHVTGGERAGHIEVCDGMGIVFVLLPGGRFTMGSQDQDPHRPNYDPQHEVDEALHEVTLSPFFLARHELTQGQWQRLSGGETPSYCMAGSSPGGGTWITWSNPVEGVDWDMCTGLLGRHGMVLPTDAQWEYGCRAGTTTAWVCAFEELVRHANLADATARHAIPSWTYEEWTDGHAVHAPVGSFVPNLFGLFDVHGNVWEWTRNSWQGPGAVPRAGDGLRGDPGSSSNRLFRGGGFNFPARSARSSFGIRIAPSFRSLDLGLRAARTLLP